MCPWQFVTSLTLGESPSSFLIRGHIIVSFHKTPPYFVISKLVLCKSFLLHVFPLFGDSLRPVRGVGVPHIYTPHCHCLVGLVGFEPTTSCVSSRHSTPELKTLFKFWYLDNCYSITFLADKMLLHCCCQNCFLSFF